MPFPVLALTRDGVPARGVQPGLRRTLCEHGGRRY